MCSVSISAQEWSLKPGPRDITVHVRHPGAGSKIGSADPGILANEFNVIAVGVDYLQSGP